MEIGLPKNPCRRFVMDRAATDTEGVHDISFSSEYPVLRYDWRNDEYYDEILSHNPDDVDMSRLNAGGSIRDTHFGDQVGVVQEAYLKDKQGRAKIRFSKATARAQEIEQDVIDGIRKNVSVRYDVQEIVRIEVPTRDNDLERKRVHFRWSPVHISFEPDPADPTVGAGRSKDDQGEAMEFGNDQLPAAGSVPEAAPASGREINDPPISMIWINETKQ